MNLNEINSLVLAYVGDSYYDLLVRKYLISLKINKVNDLQKESLKYVSAKSQADILKKLLEKNIFSDLELDVIKRARNCKTHSKPKNCDIITYKHATALEAVIGYLYLNEETDRIEEIFKEVIVC